MTPTFVDVAVVGAGPAGLLTGLCCSAAGLATAVAGPGADPRDGRTAALLGPSITVLKRLGLWEALSPHATAVSAIRLVDGTHGIARAPEVLFRASEIGLDAFGYNIPNAALTRCMEDAGKNRFVRIVSAGVDEIDLSSDTARLGTREGHRIEAALIAAADGRGSLCRRAAQIDISASDYDQTALVTTFTHSRPHEGISTEFHRDSGPLTLVPGPANTSSIVWVERPAEAQRLAALGDHEFADILSRETSALLGTLSDFAPRRTHPISGLTAKRLAANRVALVGEAAHVLPPIGAQGLNLSFRDGATLAQIAGEARAAGRDPGGDDLLQDYERRRRPDAATRAVAVDFLNRSLLSMLPGVRAARGFGLFALTVLPALKAQVMRYGIMPVSDLPAIMKTETLAAPAET